MPYETGRGRRGLYRSGDVSHPYRKGKVTPVKEDIPAEFQDLVDWYHDVYDAPRSAESGDR